MGAHPSRDLGPVLGAELADDVVHVRLGGLLGDAECLPDLPVRRSACDEACHLLLAHRERADGSWPAVALARRPRTPIRPTVFRGRPPGEAARRHGVPGRSRRETVRCHAAPACQQPLRAVRSAQLHREQIPGRARDGALVTHLPEPRQALAQVIRRAVRVAPMAGQQREVVARPGDTGRVAELGEQVGCAGVVADGLVVVAAGPRQVAQERRGDGRAPLVVVDRQHAGEKGVRVVEIAASERQYGGDQQGAGERVARCAWLIRVDDGERAVQGRQPVAEAAPRVGVPAQRGAEWQRQTGVGGGRRMGQCLPEVSLLEADGVHPRDLGRPRRWPSRRARRGLRSTGRAGR